MRPYLYHLIVLVLGVFCIAACQQNPAPVDENARPMIYSEKQLESFLDSVGHLPIEPMVKKARHYSDSIFHGIQPLAVSWSEEDFSRLQVEAKEGGVSESLAQKYQLNYQKEMLHEGKLPAESFIFNLQNGEFALNFGLGTSWGTEVYFFQNSRCVAKQHIEHRYGLEIEHYVDEAGKTVIYYKENFASGTGIWWFDYYFYRYEDGKLLPVLSELQNGNLSMIPAYRSKWLESTIVSTKPLTLKMVYYLSGENGEYIINDSTNVQYRWDVKTKMLKGDYEHSKLSQNQILAYNLGTGNDLFFIRAHYEKLKQHLKDKSKRRLILYFLNEAKADLSY